MYIWGVNNLAEDFRDNKVTAKEEMKYLIVWCGVLPLIAGGAVWECSSAQIKILHYVEIFCIFFVDIVGIYACYRINAAGDGKNFITRFLCLSVPAGLRVTFFWFMLLFGLLFFIHAIGLDDYRSVMLERDLWAFVLFVAWHIIFYAYLYRKMRAVFIVTKERSQL